MQYKLLYHSIFYKDFKRHLLFMCGDFFEHLNVAYVN